ncbi:MAG: amidohydrolase family protein [Bryobacterales bacterium]|nr:amidohydrolase family protein [Bryobacterales bacterium]
MTRRHWISTAAASALAQPGARVIDAHNHLRRGNPDGDRLLIAAADKLGIQQLCCSTLPPERPLSHEGCLASNAWTLEGMRRFPGRVLGYCTVNPGYGKSALEEVRRCVEDRGFIGVKLYNDYRADEPVLHPLIELAIQLKVPILQHAGHTAWLPSPQPRISDASHLAALATRYPEAMLICAHICGGGDWEWTIKRLRSARTVLLDTSGSVIDDGVVDMAVRELGAERLLFACDMSMTASAARIRAATLTEAQRSAILGGNMARLLAARGRA